MCTFTTDMITTMHCGLHHVPLGAIELWAASDVAALRGMAMIEAVMHATPHRHRPAMVDQLKELQRRLARSF